MPFRTAPLLLLAASLLGGGAAQAAEPSAAELQMQFATPPDSARPWVYWFWKNGNISREGITADLEAMQRVGIGGVILMEVALSTPPGPVPFFSPQWRELFAHAVAEADRLGLQIALNSAPGWTGSGGVWVTPEQSMQKLVASPVQVSGPQKFDAVLPQPETVADFYRDIAVLAYPTPEETALLPDLAEKALYRRGAYSSQPGVPPSLPTQTDYPPVSNAQRIAWDTIVDLSEKMDASGRLVWEVPAGAWTIVRFGHTSTGQTNRPAPSAGLECDKLDRAALESHFRQFTAELLKDVGEHGRRALVATHLDSWEVGAQNWSPQFRQEFENRRGYDLLRYLPVMTGHIVDSREVSERFLWDLRQTVSELIVENHGQYLCELAHQHGLWLSIEPYDMTPCDDMSLGATADVPMCEFWSNTFDTRYSVREATSIGHVYGRPVIAAEAFTSTESWLLHPGGIKPIGDWAFCEGVNRFVIHRYVHQPFPQIRPGLSLGPHGVHYERTQTWWEWTRPWHQYLARCQYLLQQGRWVADVLYLNPEGAPNVFQSPRLPLEGYKLDACTPEALRTRVRVEDGRLVLPDGQSYRMLVLPEQETMTPELLACVGRLVKAGATVVGPPPRKSPSLAEYPHCDDRVAVVAGWVWGPRPTAPGRMEHSSGQGRVIWQAEAEPSAASQPAPVAAQCRWIWGGDGQPAAAAPVGRRYFRRSLTLPEKAVESAEILMSADNAFIVWINGHKVGYGGDFTRLTSIDVTNLVKSGQNFLAVIGENGGDGANPAGLLGALVVRYTDGQRVVVGTDSQWQTSTEMADDWATNPEAEGGWTAAVELGPAGMAPWGEVAEPEHRRYYPPTELVRDVLGRLAEPDFTGPAALGYAHRRIGELDAYFVSNPSEAVVEASCRFRVVGKSPSLWHPETGLVRPLATFSAASGGTTVPLRLEPGESFFVVFRPETRPVVVRGKNFPSFNPLQTVEGPWTVSFSAAEGGPEQPVMFDQLVDWTQRPEEGIKYYSGTAHYQQTFTLEASPPGGKCPRYFLDLGRVAVMAQVRLNGRDLGIAWKAPYRLEVTEAITPGQNQLEVAVVNLWPNRMIGDERLPLDCELRSNRSLATWPQWLLEGKPSPTGRHTFASWRDWTADAPLLESGLLGPVTLMVETGE